MLEYDIVVGTQRVSAHVPHNKLEERLSQVRNCHPDKHIYAYRIVHELAYHFDPQGGTAECQPEELPQTA